MPCHRMDLSGVSCCAVVLALVAAMTACGGPQSAPTRVALSGQDSVRSTTPPPIGEVSWGEPARSRTERGGEVCTLYSELAVLEEPDGYAMTVAPVQDAPDCAMPDDADVYEIGEDVERAVWGELVVLAEHTGSEYRTLTVHKAPREVLLGVQDVPPQATLGVFGERWLIYGEGVDLEQMCEGVSYETPYAEVERACWPKVQQAYPALRDVPAPGCDCGPSGLRPFPILHRVVRLDDLTQPPVEVPRVACGCS